MKRIISIAIILIVMATVLCSCGQQPKGIGEAGISLEEFNKLSLNMTYDKVCDIIGSKGQIVSESKYDEEEYIRFTTVYRFEGEINGYAELEFTLYSYKELFKTDFNRYLTSKQQHELQ